MKERREQVSWWNTRDVDRKHCLCGCGVPNKGKAFHASAACRKRRQRQLDKATSESHSSDRKCDTEKKKRILDTREFQRQIRT